MKNKLRFTLITSAVLMFSCGNKTALQPTVLASSISVATANSAQAAEAEIDNSQTDIGVIFQEYEDGNIVEILQVQYDGNQSVFEQYNWINPEIERINHEISAGPLLIYQNFLDGGMGDNIEIRSYPFMDDELVQIVTSCIVYPNDEPYDNMRLFSYNFSKTENKNITVDDALEMYGFTQDILAQKFEELYGQPDETVESFNASGFLMAQSEGNSVTRFLLEVMLKSSFSTEKSFFMYTPENNELQPLDPSFLFDPTEYEMVQMEPSLIAQQNDFNGFEDSYNDVKGDDEQYFTYEDVDNNLILYYPNVFASYGEYDENGYMCFKSMQDNTELHYWVTPNTYNEDPAAFCDRVSSFNSMELEHNVVIGFGESLNQETGDVTLSAYYWVVDVDWIVNVAILCETPEAAAEWCRLMEEYIIYVESTGGM